MMKKKTDHDANTNPRILLVAHHANPEWTSEPLIGWRWASELDRRADIELITHSRNRGAIERAGGLRGKIHYVDTERTASVMNRINDRVWSKAAVVNRCFLDALALLAFDREATRIARERVQADAIDIIHRVSPISPRFPTRLGTLGVPFVLGPVNGGLETAPGFPEIEARESAGFQKLRSLARLLDPRQLTFRRASAILIANETTRGVLPVEERSRATVVCENAVDLPSYTPSITRSGRTLRLLFVGRLLPYKGVHFILRAMSRADVDCTLDIVGDGPERRSLEALTELLGLQDRVRFRGAVPSDEIAGWMSRSDVFCFPSVRESGGSVVLEAMAAGTPAIVVDHGGPAETVSAKTGIRLTGKSSEAVVRGLATCIEDLSRNETRRARLGREARRSVERHYSWTRKIDRVLEVYRGLVSERREEAVAA